MPSWVQDEPLWLKAQTQVSRDIGRFPQEFSQEDWGKVAHQYHLLGGRSKKNPQSSFHPPSKKYLKFIKSLDEAYNQTQNTWDRILEETIVEVLPTTIKHQAFMTPVCFLLGDDVCIAEEFKLRMFTVPYRVRDNVFDIIRTDSQVVTRINRLLKEHFELESDPIYLRANCLLLEEARRHLPVKVNKIFELSSKYKDRNGVFLDIFNILSQHIKLLEDGSYYVKD
jgi:hypothetical protein